MARRTQVPASRPAGAGRRTAAAVLLTLLTCGTGGLWAQQTTVLHSLEVALWPEYDQPSVLVMLRGFLPDDAPLPTTVPVQIPEYVGMPHAVAKGGADNQLLVAPYTRQVEENWATIEIVTDSRRIHLEYYTALTRDGVERSFTYTWPGGITVRQLRYEVQQPRGSSDFQIEPPSRRQSVGTDGLAYHLAELGSVAPDETLTIQVSYTKELPGLTTSELKPSHSTGEEAPEQAAAPAAATGQGDTPLWPFLLLLGLVVAILAAWIAVSRRKGSAPSAAETGDDEG